MTRTFALTSLFRFGSGNIALRALNALVDADRRYRERCQLGRMTDAELLDIGMTRDDVYKL